MKIVIQRVSQAHVEVEGKIVGAIKSGVVVLVGITHKDTTKQTQWLVNKLVNLRIFEDNQGKMNRSLLDSQGNALIISQFTLYGNCDSGRRPSFIEAASPDFAEKLYKEFVDETKKNGIFVQTGIFGAMMNVHLVNDGPVTLCLEKNA